MNKISGKGNYNTVPLNIAINAALTHLGGYFRQFSFATIRETIEAVEAEAKDGGSYIWLCWPPHGYSMLDPAIKVTLHHVTIDETRAEFKFYLKFQDYPPVLIEIEVSKMEDYVPDDYKGA